MDTQLAPFQESCSWEVPRRARIGLLIAIWIVAASLCAYVYVQRPVGYYTGPPVEIDLGGFNVRGDRRMMQKAPLYDPNKPLAGLHPVIVWNEHYHSLEVCEDVFHNYYANEHDAKLGILMDPARYAQVHPKLGHRGCWHMIGLVKW